VTSVCKEKKIRIYDLFFIYTMKLCDRTMNMEAGRQNSSSVLVREPVHTTPGKFENASLFLLTVRPTVHSNPLRKRRFLKTLFKLEDFENAGFSFLCGRKTL